MQLTPLLLLKPDHTANERGFTLIEMSIVLVIIGLIIGGIFVGQDMIKSAAMRGTLGQMEKFTAAINTFRVKYNCIPGDCNSAVAFGLGTSGQPGANGDGNGRIFSDYQMFTGSRGSNNIELFNAWYHLAQAGLVEGSYNGYPAGGFPSNSFPGDFSLYAPRAKLRDTVFINVMSIDNNIQGSDTNFGNAFTISGQNTSSPSFSSGLTAAEAYSIDLKLDDGQPLSGIVRSMYPAAGPRVTGNYNGCLIGGGSLSYDVKGLWAAYGLSMPNSPPNPAQIGCVIAVGKAF